MSDEKPNKCKFCGGECFLWENCNLEKNTSMWYIKCDTCLFASCNYKTPEEALAAWNRKPEPEPITAEGLEWFGFVLVEELSPYYLLSKGNKGIIVHFHDQLPLPLVTVYEKGCIIESLDFLNVTTMQDIADLKRLFLGVESEKGDVSK